jgi:hypothetical protein
LDDRPAGCGVPAHVGYPWDDLICGCRVPAHVGSTPRTPLALPAASEGLHSFSVQSSPPPSFPCRHRQQEFRWRRRQTSYPRALGGGSGLLLPGDGLARWLGSRERVVLGAAARSLAAGQHGGAGGWRRPLGPDLVPFGPHLG